MNLYHTNEADFVLPAAMQDRSIHVFAYTASDPFALAPASPAPDTPPEYSVVLTRETIAASESIDHYAARQLRVLQDHYAEFALVEQQDVFVDDVLARVIEFSTTTPQGPIRQRQAYLLCPATTLAASGERMRVALTLTATTKAPLAPRYAFLFEQLLYSFTFLR